MLCKNLTATLFFVASQRGQLREATVECTEKAIGLRDRYGDPMRERKGGPQWRPFG